MAFFGCLAEGVLRFGFKGIGMSRLCSLGSIALVLVSASVSHGQNLDLTCATSAGDERAALSRAPTGTSRPLPHRLTVAWKGGIRVFVDQPPHDEGLSGVHYLYCGYEPTLGFHLIHKQDRSVFTGVLLNDTTGQVLSAGERVIFSGDRRQYFAAIQPDGLDGQEWHVRSRDGVLIWKGRSAVAEKGPKYDYVIANLDKVHWNGAGQLQATLTCEGGRGKSVTGSVTLTRTDKGWAWLPEIHCPRTSP
jgi:hypothetical protein